MSTAKCKDTCPTGKQQPCVKPGMGGHAGAFVNACYKDGAAHHIGCGKKLDAGAAHREHFFYTRLGYLRPDLKHIASFRSHISAIHGQCTKGGEQYFIMDNAFEGLEDAMSLDFKLGRRTAFLIDSSWKKKIIHEQLIDPLSTSQTAAFRLEGATNRDQLVKSATHGDGSDCSKMTIPNLADKKKLYFMHPFFVFEHFFKDDVPLARSLLAEIRQLNTQFTLPNIQAAMRGELALAFIGSSILLIRGRRDGADVATFKLIDFGHPFVYMQDYGLERNDFLRFVENYTNGLLSLTHALSKWVQTPRCARYPELGDVFRDFTPFLVADFILDILRASGLAKADVIGASDPYCVVTWCGRECHRTEVIRNTLNPQWSAEYVSLLLPQAGQADRALLRIECFDHDVVGRDDFLGEVVLDGEAIRNAARTSSGEICKQLAPRAGRKKSKLIQGALTLRLRAHRPANPAAASSAKPPPETRESHTRRRTGRRTWRTAARRLLRKKKTTVNKT